MITCDQVFYDLPLEIVISLSHLIGQYGLTSKTSPDMNLNPPTNFLEINFNEPQHAILCAYRSRALLCKQIYHITLLNQIWHPHVKSSLRRANIDCFNATPLCKLANFEQKLSFPTKRIVVGRQPNEAHITIILARSASGFYMKTISFVAIYADYIYMRSKDRQVMRIYIICIYLRRHLINGSQSRSTASLEWSVHLRRDVCTVNLFA